jgi:hypothetical protein
MMADQTASMLGDWMVDQSADQSVVLLVDWMD